MRRQQIDPKVTFTCEPSLYGAIPEPVPAAKMTPEWFKKIPQRIQPGSAGEFPSETIKACMPVLDAFQAGYIIPSAAPVRFVVEGEEITTTWRSEEIPMVQSHSPAQVEGSMWPGPYLKWINYWLIKTPPGYSSLITAPFNRPNAVFQCLSAVVDTDTYPNQINFPCIWTGPRDYDDIIPSGTPLVQVIPFKRETWSVETRPTNTEETHERAVALKRLGANLGSYRDVWRQVKRWR